MMVVINSASSAGSSGLAAAKNLKQHAIPFDVVEREDDIGGIWYHGKTHSSIHRSTRLISSKSLTQYTTFPCRGTIPTLDLHALLVAKFVRAIDQEPKKPRNFVLSRRDRKRIWGMAFDTSIRRDTVWKSNISVIENA
jgi:cation diffusion facilitator CzcD-associated flavoprotein CzcO